MYKIGGKRIALALSFVFSERFLKLLFWELLETSSSIAAVGLISIMIIF